MSLEEETIQKQTHEPIGYHSLEYAHHSTHGCPGTYRYNNVFGSVSFACRLLAVG